MMYTIIPQSEKTQLRILIINFCNVKSHKKISIHQTVK